MTSQDMGAKDFFENKTVYLKKQLNHPIIPF